MNRDDRVLISDLEQILKEFDFRPATRDPRPATRDPRPATISQSRHSEQFTESIVEIFTRLNIYSNRAGVIYFWAPREVFKKKNNKIQFQSPECEVLSVC